jgi:hypothetical protein
MKDRCAPYVELVEKNMRTVGLRWRFVDPRRPSVSIKRGEGQNGISYVSRITVRTTEGEGFFILEPDFSPSEGDAIEGEVTFDMPIDIKQISYVAIFFNYSDSFGDGVRTEYSWRFYTEGRD